MRKDSLDPLPYTAEMPSLMSAAGRVDVHSVVAHYLMDNRLHGAYLEFGVGRGRSAVSALRAYSRSDVCQEFHLFDSFAGLPALKGADVVSRQFQEGSFAFTEQQVRDFLVEHGVWDQDRISLHSGWFENTVASWVARVAPEGLQPAVVHMDMDLRDSCATVLDAITPLLRTGVVMLFDDWNCFSASNQLGERRAVREWLARTPEIALNAWFPYGWHGQVFFCDVTDTKAGIG
jgi:O-methyltransferase